MDAGPARCADRATSRAAQAEEGAARARGQRSATGGRSALGVATIGFVYLAWAPLGPAPLRQFLRSDHARLTGVIEPEHPFARPPRLRAGRPSTGARATYSSPTTARVTGNGPRHGCAGGPRTMRGDAGGPRRSANLSQPMKAGDRRPRAPYGMIDLREHILHLAWSVRAPRCTGRRFRGQHQSCPP